VAVLSVTSMWNIIHLIFRTVQYNWHWKRSKWLWSGRIIFFIYTL